MTSATPTGVAAAAGTSREALVSVLSRLEETDAVREQRSAAFRRFEERGFPTPRDEAWRHTSVARIARTSLVTPPADTTPSAEVLAQVGLAGFRGPVAVFVNGRHAPHLSSAGEANSGVEVGSLKEALRREPRLGEEVFGTARPGSAFSDLNAALHEDGAFVSIAPGAVAAHPVHLVFVSAGGPEPAASHPRSLIVAGRGSEGRVISTYAGRDGIVYFTNAVTGVRVEEGASLEHFLLQSQGAEAFHVGALDVRLARGGRFKERAVLLGAALGRQETTVRFAGEGGECQLDGLFYADGDRHTDVHTVIDHASPHCSSRQLYKGVVDGRARGVFTGLVRVRAGAQKTDAAQSNKNLLLSRDALVHSTPQLEILADDVKCKHGSTTGQLDPAAVFYLRSRGIDEADARGLLTLAFASELVRAMPIEALRAEVARQVAARLGRNLSLEAA